MKNSKDRRVDNKITIMEPDKKIALVAHDNKKTDLVEWAKFNKTLLAHHKIYATGTTGAILEKELGFQVNKLQSGVILQVYEDRSGWCRISSDLQEWVFGQFVQSV